MNRIELFELIRPERRRVVFSLLVAVVQGVLLYPALWLVRELFDSVIPGGQGWLAVLTCAAILAARLAAAEVGLLQRTLAMRAAKGAAAYRRQQLVRWLLGSSMARLEDEDPGRIESRLVHETERLDVMLNRGLSVVVPSVVATLLALGAMAVLEWRLALLTVVLGFPVAWLAGRGGEATTTATRAFQGAFERFTSSVRFAVRHLLLVRSRGQVADETAQQDAAIENLRGRGVHMAVSYARQARLQTVSVTTVAVAVLALGSLLVIDGGLTVGGLAAFYVSALVCASAVGLIGGAIPDLKGGMVAAERLEELTGATQPSSPAGAAVPASILPLRLIDIEFSYGDRPILSGVDLEVAAARHVDLSGPNGAGKSTLVRLVLALESPAAGTITAGGALLPDLDAELVRRRIGYAPQKPTFFSGSVVENLLYGRPEATRADAERAAALAGIADVVAALDGGYDAPLGEDGVRLSGGEGQRLAIARALIGNPELVILDEPGNHLPQLAVADIVGRVRQARPDVALLTIGHGHLAPGVADLSLRLDDGRLAESVIDG